MFLRAREQSVTLYLIIFRHTLTHTQPPLVPYVPEADSTYSVRPVQARSRRESVSGHGNVSISLKAAVAFY